MNREARWLLCVCLVLLFGASSGHAQEQTDEFTVCGFLTDRETGQPLPYVQVRVTDQLKGALTNSDGVFEIHLDTLPAELNVTYIGYQTETVTFAKVPDDTLHIALTPAPVVLDEIVVTAEDPAIAIMREVIKRKQEWRADLQTYHADAYTRVTVSNEEEIATIMESISDVYWHTGMGIEEIIVSKRQAENFDGADNFAMARIIPNLYDDNIEIIGFDMIGVTNPDALDCYDFKLTGRRLLDKKTVYDISVTPKKKLQPSFIGSLSVLDGDYAMIAISVKPNDVVNLPSPLNNFDIAFAQQYNTFGGSYWLPVDVRIDATMKLGIMGLKFPPVKYRQLTRLSDYDINVIPPDSLFDDTEGEFELSINASSNSLSISAGDAPEDVAERERRAEYVEESRQNDREAGNDISFIVIADESADSTVVQPVDIDSLFAASPLVIPYTEEETRAYAEIDSTDDISDAFRPTGFLARMIPDENTEPVKQEPPKEPTRFDQIRNAVFEPLSYEFSANRVDNASAGLTFEKQLFGIDVAFTGMYRDEPDDWGYKGSIGYRFGRRQRGYVRVEGETGTAPIFESDAYPEWMNTLSVITSRDDYNSYYENRGVHIIAGHPIGWRDLSIEGAVNIEQHTSRTAASPGGFLPDRVVLQPNSAVNEGNLHSVAVSMRYGQSTSVAISGSNHAEFSIEHSNEDLLDSDFSFTHVELTMERRFDTFFRRRLLPNTLDVKVSGGYTDGNLPIQRYGGIDGAFGVYSPFGVLRSLRNRPLLGRHHAAVFWEHNFRTVPFEIIGADWVANKGIGIVLHGASARIWDNRDKTNDRHEIGLSLNGLFTILRIDITRRLDKDGFYVGCGFARIL